MIGAASSLVAMALLVRLLAPDYHVLELIFLRSVVNLCLMAPWIFRAGSAAIRTERLALHGLRNGLLYCRQRGVVLRRHHGDARRVVGAPVHHADLRRRHGGRGARRARRSRPHRGGGGGVRRHADHRPPVRARLRRRPAGGARRGVLLRIRLHRHQAAGVERVGQCRRVLHERLRAGLLGDTVRVRLAHAGARRPAGDRRAGRRRLRRALLRDTGDGGGGCELRGAVRLSAPAALGRARHRAVRRGIRPADPDRGGDHLRRRLVQHLARGAKRRRRSSARRASHSPRRRARSSRAPPRGRARRTRTRR